MSRRARLPVAVLLGVLVLSIAAPARSATRLRVYEGETSQGGLIRFRVQRTDYGRFIERMRWATDLTCEDQTTLSVDSFGFDQHIPVTDGAFVYDDSHLFGATHLAGTIGRLRGSGTLTVSLTVPTEEDALPPPCVSGDLTWEVEYVRTIRRD